MINKLWGMFLRSDKFFVLPVIFCLTISIIILIYLSLIYSQLPSKLPLLYSMPWGESQLVDKAQFFSLPAVTILITLLNGFIALHVHPSQVVLKRILALSLILIGLITTITTFNILTIFV